MLGPYSARLHYKVEETPSPNLNLVFPTIALMHHLAVEVIGQVVGGTSVKLLVGVGVAMRRHVSHSSGRRGCSAGSSRGRNAQTCDTSDTWGDSCHHHQRC